MHTHTHIYIYFFCRLMYIYVSMYCKLLVMIMSGCGYGALCHWWLKYETQSNRVMVFILRGLIHSPYVVKLLILFFFVQTIHTFILNQPELAISEILLDIWNRAFLARLSATSLQVREINLNEIELKDELNTPMSWSIPLRATTAFCSLW